jgi:hypothetical protein
MKEGGAKFSPSIIVALATAGKPVRIADAVRICSCARVVWLASGVPVEKPVGTKLWFCVRTA